MKLLIKAFCNTKKKKKNSPFPQLMVVEGITLPQYLTVYFLNGYEEVNPLFKGFERFKQTAGQDWQMFASTINYRLFSFHEFKKELSYLPKIKSSYKEMPYLYYVIYSVKPKGEEFESYIQKKVQEEENNKEPTLNFAWRVWKTVFGGDVPKYIVALSTSGENVIEDKKGKVLFKGGSLEEIIRRVQEGKGKVRLDPSQFSMQS